MEAEQTNLSRNEEYKVRLYPNDTIVTGKYLGASDGTHIFSAELTGEDAFLFVSDHWIEIKNNVISHKSISSARVSGITKQRLSNLPSDEKSRLLRKLNQVGVEL